MRVAVIKKSKCIAPNDCNYVCQQVCPRNRAGIDCITIGSDKKPIISEPLCIACQICVNKCPANCIHILNLPEELQNQAFHRYSVNGFKLFRTIVPVFGKVVGVLGQNGIGKTTAISILAGLTYPNLGEPGAKPEQKEIFNFFKGTESQSYFRHLFDKKIKIGYKPQYVDAIPREFKGTVKELLEKIETDKDFGKIAEELELNEIMTRKVSAISGGELQRVAIAATILKNANVLFFDEPSSYLDIKQRLKIAQMISSLVSKEKSINVVEHDLIVLDYMADSLHIMSGLSGVYGIVSHPMSGKEGINTYLSGYLKDENLRFREKPITFELRPPGQSKKTTVLASWPILRKKLGEFSLEVLPGEIYVNEVVGCLGENGTGKTTFAKILAGELTTDSGKPDSKLKISYKPQYIKPDSELTVSETLRSVTKEYGTDSYRISIITPLQIDSLLKHKINELSGGELQRVAIAVCLSREAKLYLLDEPSAYLDVEQRLSIAKSIREIVKKKNASAIVIDHDLLFLDYLSERLLVFQGTPSKKGITKGPVEMKEGMNLFLSGVGITMRRDVQTKRPRINKLDSVLDREQKSKGDYYYS